MNRFKITLLALSTIIAAALPLAAQPPAGAPAAARSPAGRGGGRASPHEAINGRIDGFLVALVYGRPYSARGGQGEKRKIWGELVPFGKVWRTGSDEATLLVLEKPMTVGGATVPSGAYTLWTLPAADGSAKLIINKQVGQWGIDRAQNALRDEKLDLAIVDLTKETLETPVDQFTMAVVRNPAGGGVIRMSWENLAYSVPVAAVK